MAVSDCDDEYPEFLCVDCGYNTIGDEYYMVHDEVWQAAGMDEGMLCVGCLETRLGRMLGADDFPRVPVNDEWRHSERLASRIANEVVHYER